MLGITATLLGSYEKVFGANGKVYMRVQAHDTLVAKTTYQVICNEFGPTTAAVSDNVHRYYVGVPEKAIVSGTSFLIQIGGDVDDMVTPSLSETVGHGLKMYDGAITTVGANFSGDPGEFCVVRTASTSSTTQDVTLIPAQIIGTT